MNEGRKRLRRRLFGSVKPEVYKGMTVLKSASRITAAIVVGLPLIACQSIQDNPKQTGGGLLGAGLGALIGSQVGSGKGKLAAVAVGALAGA